MRRLQYTILSFVFAMLIFGAGATQSDPCLVYNTPTVALVFDDLYTSLSVVIIRIDYEVLSVSGAPIGTSSFTPREWTLEAPVAPSTVGSFRIPIRAQEEPLPNGLYQCRVRVWDAYGNVSGWSEILWCSKQWRTLPTPGGCRTVS